MWPLLPLRLTSAPSHFNFSFGLCQSHSFPYLTHCLPVSLPPLHWLSTYVSPRCLVGCPAGDATVLRDDSLLTVQQTVEKEEVVYDTVQEEVVTYENVLVGQKEVELTSQTSMSGYTTESSINVYTEQRGYAAQSSEIRSYSEDVLSQNYQSSEVRYPFQYIGDVEYKRLDTQRMDSVRAANLMRQTPSPERNHVYQVYLLNHYYSLNNYLSVIHNY